MGSGARRGSVRGCETVSRWARRMRSSWLPRTQEAPREMARSMTAGEKGPLEMRSPVSIRWSWRLLKEILESRWTTGEGVNHLPRDQAIRSCGFSSRIVRGRRARYLRSS